MKRLLHSLAHMDRAPLLCLRLCLAECCLLAFGGFVLSLCAQNAAGAEALRLAAAATLLSETPAGVLLLGGIGAVILQFGP